MARLSRLFFGDLAVEESVDIEVLDTLQCARLRQLLCMRGGILVAPRTYLKHVRVSSCLVVQNARQSHYKVVKDIITSITGVSV